MKKIYFQFPLMLLLLMSMPLHAAKWTTSKSASISTIFSDNIDLENDAAADSGTTVEIRPSVGIQGEGARLQLDFNYSLGAVFNNGSDDSDDFEDSHFLNAVASIEAIEDNLFIDVNANAGISLIDSTDTIAPDINAGSNNTTQTYSLSVSPYARYHFGTFADGTLRYNTDTFSTGTSGNDSDMTEWSLSLDSGRRFQVMTWGLSASYSDLSYDNDTNDEKTNVNSNFQYQLNRKFSLDFGLGYENYELDNELNDYDDTEGMTWDVGTTWTPNPRTTLKVSYGDDILGGNWSMDFKYRHRKSTITSSYTTSITNSRTERLDSIARNSSDINGDPLFYGDEDLYLDPLLPSLSSENIVQDMFRLAYQFSSKKTTIGIDASYAERDYQDPANPRSTEDFNTSISLSRKLSPVTSLTSRISWLQREETTADSDEEVLTLRVGVNTSLGVNSNLSVDFQHSDSDSSGTVYDDDYEENRVSATLGMTF